MACSTEFYVLGPLASSEKRSTRGAREHGASLAFLLPWLLGAEAQAILAAAQERGHHPRVPREVLLAMRVEQRRLRERARLWPQVERAVVDALDGRRRLSRLIEE